VAVKTLCRLKAYIYLRLMERRNCLSVVCYHTNIHTKEITVIFLKQLCVGFTKTGFISCEISVLMKDLLFFAVPYTLTLFYLTNNHYEWPYATFVAVPVILLSGARVLLQCVAANMRSLLLVFREAVEMLSFGRYTYVTSIKYTVHCRLKFCQ
jgi:hypothetical protein